jgi:Bacterial sugar transferase
VPTSAATSEQEVLGGEDVEIPGAWQASSARWWWTLINGWLNCAPATSLTGYRTRYASTPWSSRLVHDDASGRINCRSSLTSSVAGCRSWDRTSRYRRSNLSWEGTVRLDLRYMENWSFALDLQILWKTFSVIFTRSGAY